MGWPGPLDARTLADNAAKIVLQKAQANVAVLVDRGLKRVQRILIPVGGGPHSRLAIRLAYEIAEQEDAQITALYCFSEVYQAEELEDRMLLLREIIEDELGSVPSRITTRLAHADGVFGGILEETTHHQYDLIVIGASEEWASRMWLFGSIDDQIAEEAVCSVLLVRRYAPAVISWIRRQMKR